MARFYNTTKGEYVRDNVYTPPIEMLTASLLKKDADIQQTADSLELLRGLKIDNLDIDKEGAQKIKSDIDNQIDSLVPEIQKNLLSPDNKSKLNDLKRSIQERVNTGDIYKIQTTAKNYRDFESKLESDKTLSSAQKEKHKSTYWNDFLENNPDGSVNGSYTPGPIIQDADYLGEYQKWFDNLKPDAIKALQEKIGKKWITATASEKKGLMLENGFETFLEARPDLKELVEQQGNSKVYADRGITFDADGNLDYTKGILGNLGKAAKEMNYLETDDSTKYEMNPMYLPLLQMQRADAEKAEAKRLATLAEVSVDASKQYAASKAAIVDASFMLQDINQRLGKTGNDRFSSLDEIVNYPGAAKLWPRVYENAKAKIKVFKSRQQASWAYATDKFGKDVSDDLKSRFEKAVMANAKNIKFNIPQTEFMAQNEKGDYVPWTVDYQNAKGMGLDEAVGKTMISPENKRVKIIQAKVVPESSIPIFANTPENNGYDINKNDAVTNLEFIYEEAQADGTVVTKSFQRPANFYMEDAVGIRTK